MKNITFSADEHLIRRARATAQLRHTTLNEEFRAWLEQYAADGGEELARNFDELMKRLSYVNTGGRKFTRDKMNER